MEKLAKELITGKRLKRNDNLEFLLTVNLKELCAGTNIIREKLCEKK